MVHLKKWYNKISRVGIFSIDEKHKKALVKPLTSTPVEIKRGDIVLAQ